MKESVSPGVAIGIVVAAVILVAIIGIKMFAPQHNSTKPPPEKQAEIAQQKQAMQHYMQQQSHPGAPVGAGGQTSQQQQYMQNYFKNQQGQH